MNECAICTACGVIGAAIAVVGLCYLLYRSHERFRKSHTKDSK